MKRQILLASILAATLMSVLTAANMSQAEAKFTDASSPYLVVNTKGIATCFQQEGDFCGGSKMNSKLGLSVLETSSTGQISGVAKTKLTHFVGQDPGGEGITLKSNDLIWVIDTNTRQISIDGIVKGDDKSSFKVEIKGWYTLPEVDDEVMLRTTIIGADNNIITGFTIGTGTDILELVDKSAEK